jgi:hypothetical protein
LLVAQKLARLVGRDVACADLVERSFCRLQFVDDVRHPSSTLTVRQTEPPGSGTNHDLVPEPTLVGPDLV